ncbi:uncharacterized protein BP5553_06153 [Venustampulla echinocandica]|uniref:Uncharacterized protein n=1 Tax=Venustampulla echinocandica TaxID=2656787 RepID=A0A370TMR4_9HELO|nr:uncharacterized protein BP5553_06153 [Venustampulla echinocandica]RDL36801.1 hypothetical protein BP5553_06153 [Venustampulla echinocandica]
MLFKLLTTSSLLLAVSAQIPSGIPGIPGSPSLDGVPQSIPTISDVIPSGAMPSNTIPPSLSSNLPTTHGSDTSTVKASSASESMSSHMTTPAVPETTGTGNNGTQTTPENKTTKTSGGGHGSGGGGGGGQVTGTVKTAHPSGTGAAQTGEGSFARGSVSTTMASLLLAGALSFFVFA